MRAGLGVGVGKCGQVWAYTGRLGKSGQAWMGQTDLVGMSDMSSGLVLVCVQV